MSFCCKLFTSSAATGEAQLDAEQAQKLLEEARAKVTHGIQQAPD